MHFVIVVDAMALVAFEPGDGRGDDWWHRWRLCGFKVRDFLIKGWRFGVGIWGGQPHRAARTRGLVAVEVKWKKGS